jgi:hypothetical protein
LICASFKRKVPAGNQDIIDRAGYPNKSPVTQQAAKDTTICLNYQGLGVSRNPSQHEDHQL